MGQFSKPRKLDSQDEIDEFNCGQPELDDWLKKFALINQRAGMTTVFVTLSDSKVVG